MPSPTGMTDPVPHGEHHGLPLPEVVLLGTDPEAGLPQADAARRLAVGTPNALPRTRRLGPLPRLVCRSTIR